LNLVQRAHEILKTTHWRDWLKLAISEDLDTAGDVTSNALVPDSRMARAVIEARTPCRVAGAPFAAAVFREIDSTLTINVLIADGRPAECGAPIIELAGRARSILGAERIALNIMQRLTGIATLTAQFVERVSHTHAVILDTRKTIPGMRALDKYAVCCGGGENHRMGLYDRVMVKDNHRALWGGSAATLAEAVQAARERYPNLAVEVEVESIEELEDALRANPEWILLDNMPLDMMRECVAINKRASRLEASGGITRDTVAQVAETGVDAISLGCLTHSVSAADLALEMRVDV